MVGGGARATVCGPSYLLERQVYSEQEAQQRFEAALRGARIAGHKPKESMTPKYAKAQRGKKAKF